MWRKRREAHSASTSAVPDSFRSSGVPTVAATTAVTSVRFWIAANSISHTPSGNCSCSRPAVSRARRVLPQPPGPVSVTSRVLASKCAISPCSQMRPMKLVTGAGRFPTAAGRWPRGGMRAAICICTLPRSSSTSLLGAKPSTESRAVAKSW